MSKYAARRGVNNAYRSSLFSNYLKRLEGNEENVPRGTKCEVIAISPPKCFVTQSESGKSSLPSK